MDNYPEEFSELQRRPNDELAGMHKGGRGSGVRGRGVQASSSNVYTIIEIFIVFNIKR